MTHPLLDPPLFFAAGLVLYVLWHAAHEAWHHHRPRPREREKGAR